MAMAAVFGSSRIFDSAAQPAGSKEAAQLSRNGPVEKQPGSVETLERGANVYTVSCQPCHGDRQGNGTTGGVSPHNEKGHTWHHPDAQLKEWIVHGKPGPGLSIMPGFGYLTKDDVEAILVLIKSWWTAEQREIQADISLRYQEAIGQQKKAR